jgi:hypothetical protein
MSIRIYDPLTEPPRMPARSALPVVRASCLPSGKSRLEARTTMLPPPAPMPAAAFHGIAGDLVRKIAPHTEADPAALLVQILVAAGNCLGRGPHYLVEATEHFANEFCILVGQSSKARKGTSYNWIARVLRQVDQTWMQHSQVHGLVSGEGIIHQIRDPGVSEKDGEATLGVSDKRLLIIEEELGGTLAALGRKDNTLSSVLRCAWDGKNLRTLAKNCGEIATDPHVSVIGHITFDELKAKLRGDLITNGFANRFLWVYAQRARLLPDGGQLHIEDLAEEIARLTAAIEAGRRCGRLRRDAAATALWHAEYERLSGERPGPVGAVTSRLEAHATRLALLYAILDSSDVIRLEHQQAALALCDYCLRSAEYVFGGLSADATAILEALRMCAPEPMTRNEIRRFVFSNHGDAARIDQALFELEARGYTVRGQEASGGAPRELWRLADGPVPAAGPLA